MDGGPFGLMSFTRAAIFFSSFFCSVFVMFKSQFGIGYPLASLFTGNPRFGVVLAA